MKLTLNILEKRDENEDKRWPHYVLGGRLRTSTLVLILAFSALLWIHVNEQSAMSPSKTTTVVPPPPPGYSSDNKGYVPDPSYTVVPRIKLQPPSTTTTPTATTTPPFVLPTLPCIPPFCNPTTTVPTTTSPLPQPGPGPVPTSSAPAR